MCDPRYPDLQFDIHMNEREARRLVEFAVSRAIGRKFLGRAFTDQSLLHMESAIHDELSTMKRLGMLGWLSHGVTIKPRRVSLNNCQFEWSDGFRTD